MKRKTISTSELRVVVAALSEAIDKLDNETEYELKEDTIIHIPDCCEDCRFHKKYSDDDRFCYLYEIAFHIDALFDSEHHHQLRPDWCDVKSVEIKNGWRE